MPQMPLPFGAARRRTLDNLVRHDGVHRALSVCLAAYERGEGPLCPVFFWGPPGCGKTHILEGMLSFLEIGRKGPRFRSVYIGRPARSSALNVLRETASSISPCESPFAVAIDDVDRLEDQETAVLWMIFNQLTRIGAPLLLASRLTPEGALKGNPHLTSRVQAGLVLKLEAPDDDARLLILKRIAREKGLRITEETLRYLITRMSRNMTEIARVLDILDAQSLAAKRPVTIPLIKAFEHGRLIP